MTVLKQQSEQKLFLIHPYYWDAEFPNLFEYMGFRIFWSKHPDMIQKRKETEEFVQENNPALALERQHGEDDFPIRDLLQKYDKETPVILILNWEAFIQHNHKENRVACYLRSPFNFLIFKKHAQAIL